MAAPDWQLTAETIGTQVRFHAEGPTWWDVSFFVPLVAHLEPGIYENAVGFGPEFPPRPRLDIFGDGRSCSTIRGRFVVLDAAYDAQGNVARFAADFEQHCDGADAPLLGSVRFAAGDDACAAAADGTPCDDRDACTALATCQAGSCMSGARTSCSENVGPCRFPGACSPASGACTAPPAKPFRAPCDDGDVCTTTQCEAGACVTMATQDCNDLSGCTDDFCDATRGCVHFAVPGVCDVSGIPATLAFVRELRGATGERGRACLFRRSDGPVYGNAYFDEYSGGVVAIAFATQTFGYRQFYFGAASGGPFGPGVYENAARDRVNGESRPVMSVDVPALCNDPVQRFAVLEATYGRPGELFAFAADFELECNDGTRFQGAVRWRAGATTCRGAADGTPCDDRNACTATATCQGGVCVGADATECAPETGPCIEATLCDPTAGACIAAAGMDDVRCTLPSECIDEGRCRAGRCVALQPTCDDKNVCTTDRCDPPGRCTHDPIAGTCWSVRTRTSFRLRTTLGSCRCSQPTEQLRVAFIDDGRVLAERSGCEPFGGLSVEAEHRWAPGAHGQRNFALDPIGLCTDVPFGFSDFVAAASVKLTKRKLSGVQTQRWRISRGNTGASVTRLVGRPTSGGTLPDVTRFRRCRDEILRCLRATGRE